MDVTCFGVFDPMVVAKVSDKVRKAKPGDVVKVLTDVEALINELRACAHMSGNVVERVDRRPTVTMTAVQQPDGVFCVDPASLTSSGSCWLVEIRVLDSNRLSKAPGHPAH